MYFGMSVSDAYLAATVNAAAVAEDHGVKAFINMSQMTLSQMSITETTTSPQHKLHWLAEAGAELVRSAGRARAADVFLEGFFLIFTSDSVRNRIRSDYRSARARLRRSQRKTLHVWLPRCFQSAAAHRQDLSPDRSAVREHAFYAQGVFEGAWPRTITFQDIPVEPWRAGRPRARLPVHLVNHLATMADLHRAGRYDRLSDDVLTANGQGPLSCRSSSGRMRRHHASAKEA